MRLVMSMITVASQVLGGCLVPFTYDVKAEECLKPSKALLQTDIEISSLAEASMNMVHTCD